MKKPYEKPMILFESFSLSTSIAVCDVQNGLPGRGTCGYPTRGGTVFITDNTGCSIVESDEEYSSFCYHNPSGYPKLFNS